MVPQTAICDACGNNLQEITYQRRAPDEPPDKVTFCPVCPLVTSRLSLSKSVIVPSLKASKKRVNFDSIKDAQTLRLVPDTCEITRRKLIMVEGAAAARCLSQINRSKDTNTMAPVLQIPSTLYMPPVIDKTGYIIKTDFINGLVHQRQIATIAPSIQLIDVDTYMYKHTIHSMYPTSIMCYESVLPIIGKASAAVIRVLPGDKKPQILVLIGTRHTNDELILDVLSAILNRYGTERSIHSFVDASTVSSLYMRSARSYDWAQQLTGYLFAWKPDGERFWCIRYGSIWLFARLRLSAVIAGWKVCNRLTPTSRVGSILDVEVLIGHPCVLLDVLLDINGEPTSTNRSIGTILDYFNQVRTDGLVVHVREYHKTLKDLMKTRTTLQYPVDGAVGIMEGSTDIIKLKDIRSVELQLSSDGKLLSSDGTLIATSDLHTAYDIGSIVELRFTKDAASGKLNVTESLLRTDKTKANDISACIDIVNAAGGTPDSLVRRRALEWCNSVRHRLYEIAVNHNKRRGRVIVDIGAGDGQAVSDYPINTDVTYLLVEPSADKCKKLHRRLTDSVKHLCRFFDRGTSIAKIFSMLATGTLRYGIVNMSIGEVIHEDPSLSIMMSCVRCCVASFSISYICKDIATLASSGISIVGCGYMYDGADAHGILIQDSGVEMKINTDHRDALTAAVTWGSDKTYSEPVIHETDFSEMFYIRPASDIVSVNIEGNFQLMKLVQRSLKVISTLRYI